MPRQLGKWIRQGETEYTRAIELRALTFLECIDPRASGQMEDIRARLLETTQLTAAGARARTSHHVRDEEGFLGPSQAVGDLAHQFACRCAIRLWRALEQGGLESDEGRGWQERAQQDYNTAMSYWSLASSPQVRAIRGERTIKYVNSMAGFATRLQIVADPREPWRKFHKMLERHIQDFAARFEVAPLKGRELEILVEGTRRFHAAMSKSTRRDR